MKNIKNLISIAILLTAQSTQAQTLRGIVLKRFDNELVPAHAAHITWKGSEIVSTSNHNGSFEIKKPPKYPATLVVSYVGFVSKEIEIQSSKTDFINIELTELSTLQNVVIEEKQPYTIQSSGIIGTQIITKNEIKKAACCNLSESFETNATVDVSYADAVTGIKKITLLGLEGKYVYLSTELLPSFRGLNQTYGLSYIPGTWIESIQVSKGPGSVVYGYESITGQINVELKKPEKEEPLFLNFFVNELARAELNVHLAHQFSNKWSTLTLLHGNYFRTPNDRNNDGFLDMPFHQQVNMVNRWKYEGEKMELILGVKYLNDLREGGQLDFFREPKLGIPFYHYSSITNRFEGFAKTGFFFEGKPYKSIGTMLKVVNHDQVMKFGNMNYTGKQNMLYANFIYESILGNTNRAFKVGASYFLDDYDETFSDTALLRTESVPGVFGEYTHSFVPEKHILVAGFRYDNHNLFGHFFTPRLHTKFNIDRLGILRLSAGRGYRIANIFTESAVLLVSSRNVLIKEALRPEVGWSYGVSLLRDFKIREKNVNLVMDYFRTDFENQIVVDMETAGELLFYNLDGSSFSNVAQADIEIEWLDGLSTRFSYKRQQVKTTFRGQKEDMPFVPAYRGLINIAYETKNDKWMFDFTSQVVGSARLPLTFDPVSGNPNKLSSPMYLLFNSQVTYKAKLWEYYLGVENLLNYTQPNPIIDAGQPFSESFDASQIWAPIFGRMMYAGLRYTLKSKKDGHK